MFSSFPPTFYSKFAFVLTLISLFSTVWSAGTVELTDVNLNSTENDTWLVEYYSPNCTYCKRLAPIWDKLVETHSDSLSKSRFYFGKVDCIANESICEKNNVDGYPTIFLYNKGKFIEEYADEHTYDAMLEYVNANAAQYKPVEAEPEEPIPTPPTKAEPVKEDDLNSSSMLKPNPDGLVVPLAPTNFSSSISHGPWFVKFYAPWCGHCKALAPTWVQVGEALRGKINVAEVDCDAHRDICNSEEVRGYPTIKFFQEGSVTLYDGDRTLDALSNFATGLTGSDIGQITINNAEDIIQNDVTFVYLHSAQSSKASVDAIYATSAQLGLQSKFYVTEDPAIAKALNATDLPKLIVFKNGHPKPYPSKIEDTTMLKNWINQERLPLLIQLDANTSDEILKTPGYVVLGILNPGSPNVSKQREALKEAAVAKYRQLDNHKRARVIFAWVDGHKWLPYVYRVFGLNTDSFPSVVILKTWDDSYFDVDAKGAVLKLSSTQIIEAVNAAQSHKLQEKSSVGIISRSMKRGKRSIGLVVGLVWRSTLVTICMLLLVTGGVLYSIIQCASEVDDESKPDKAD